MVQINLITLGLLLLTGCSSICLAQVAYSLGKADFQTNAALVPEDGVKVPPPPPPPTFPPMSSTSTTATKPTTTTTTTTTSTTTTTTTTTTEKPTTPTTTSSSTTTSTPKPTTSKPPTPSPDPIVNTWNSSCIMVKMAAQLNFTYVTKANKTATTLYNVPSEAKVNNNQSICDGQTQSLYVTWGPMGAIHSMQLNFENVNKTVKLSMLRFELPLVSDGIRDAKENQTIQLIHRGNDFRVPVNISYHCTRSQILNLTETVDSKEINGTLTVHDVQVEAFRSNKTTGFSKAHDCDSSATYDMVPWAVGIALVVLITIVLVAYLCARRRSTSRGYMSF